ncbi:MAG: hydrolase [Dehalococcoidia bacterium]|nr:MAG: hydrolase [Dehalococcoidia bacterium]
MVAQVRDDALLLPLPQVSLVGSLVVPADPVGIVLFAHGSGSSRFSPRNRYVAQVLNEARLATLLADLLTPAEEAVDARTGHLRFDIVLLAERLTGIVDWMPSHPALAALPVGLFGASTGAGAALRTAVARPHVAAVVSRGGRPDLAEPYLPQVRVPVLLIVGGADLPVLALNREALARLGGEARLEVVPGATHLFEEPGALEQVAVLARDWFLRWLAT